MTTRRARIIIIATIALSAVSVFVIIDGLISESSQQAVVGIGTLVLSLILLGTTLRYRSRNAGNPSAQDEAS